MSWRHYKKRQHAEQRRSKLFYYELFRSPIVTEKTTRLAEHDTFVFEAAPYATKFDIRQGVEVLFGKTVLDVNIINLSGKRKRFRGVSGQRCRRKKAIVRLAPGQRIDPQT